MACPAERAWDPGQEGCTTEKLVEAEVPQGVAGTDIHRNAPAGRGQNGLDQAAVATERVASQITEWARTAGAEMDGEERAESRSESGVVVVSPTGAGTGDVVFGKVVSEEIPGRVVGTIEEFFLENLRRVARSYVFNFINNVSIILRVDSTHSQATPQLSSHIGYGK